MELERRQHVVASFPCSFCMYWTNYARTYTPPPKREKIMKPGATVCAKLLEEARKDCSGHTCCISVRYFDVFSAMLEEVPVDCPQSDWLF